MTLRLFDSRRGEKVPFAPLGEGPIGLYVCGVTPYDTGHLGHAFTYISFDVLHRYLEYLGHRVVYVQNLTDVDDDLLRRARELGEDYLELGNRHVTTFLTEMAALNWLPPDVYPRATEHIPQMQALIGRLLERGHAYAAEGHVYFDIASWPSYGELSGLPRDAMLPIANERGNVADMPGKRDPLDFVLWQPSAADEPSWPSPWGAGRPGWHIECSAMSTTYLGNRFEIHGGGADLAFPHHESEIAQSEGATGERPFVSWWMHVGMLRHDGEKMSKSLGNLVLVRDLLRSYTGDAIRHYLVSHHYRDEVVFDDAGLEASAEMANQLRRACRVAEELEPFAPAMADPADLHSTVAEHRERFLAAMDDDLDTPAALPELHALAAVCHGESDPRRKAQAGWMVRELGARILGLRLATVPAAPPGEPAELPAAGVRATS
ncbi:MAG TPA: cysteine--tRNA ligase [Candidatus Limnocylindria bacterium]|nr:cysteine--tRNA ligase [Candidatus Limnocylindria bacterium]